MESGVYQIKNMMNGRIYVGSAINIPIRWRVHICGLNQGRHRNIHLQRAWNKYGASVFAFGVLESVEPENLIEQEQYWMDLLDVVKDGYNICPTAGSSFGKKASEATKRKIREARKKTNISYER